MNNSGLNCISDYNLQNYIPNSFAITQYIVNYIKIYLTKSSTKLFFMKKYLLLFITSMLFMGEIAFAQTVTVKGTVTDAASREKLVGVTIMVKSTSNGTATNQNGEFTISAKATDILLVRYTG